MDTISEVHFLGFQWGSPLFLDFPEKCGIWDFGIGIFNTFFDCFGHVRRTSVFTENVPEELGDVQITYMFSERRLQIQKYLSRIIFPQ